MKVYAVTTGDGTDGNEWGVHAIFTSMEGARAYMKAHNAHRPDWATLCDVEIWETDPVFDSTAFPNDEPKTP